MINEPVRLVSIDFQTAWLEVAKLLMSSNWEFHNLIVQIKNPLIFDLNFHDKINVFTKAQGILGPKHVAYTIFPHKLYENKGNANQLFTTYNKPRGLYDRVKTRWGTYFRRMTNYKGENGSVNQLENIIAAIRDRSTIRKAAYTS